MSQLKVHHLNCGTLHPVGGTLISSTPGVADMVCHCLLVETDQGLVLVDTGFGTADVKDPDGRLGAAFARGVRPRLDPAETAAALVAGLSLSPHEVTHIVPTHLDLDHAGGLPDFPRATVHVAVAELDAAVRRATRLERTRYIPQHWAHGARWATYPASGERWFCFDDACQLEGLPPEVLLVPLPGHTRGHCGVAIQTEQGWVLHAGDAYSSSTELAPRPPWSLALKLYHRLTEASGPAADRSRDRLRMLARDNGDQVQIFCSHDMGEFARLSGKSPSWRP